MKTNELTGAALDWAVAKAEGNVQLQYDSREGLIIKNILGWFPYRPSVAWQQGGPIIERAEIELIPKGGYWDAFFSPHDHIPYEGETLLIAAMRCYVASKLGDEVEIPEELK